MMATAVFDQLYPWQAYGLKMHFRQGYGLGKAKRHQAGSRKERTYRPASGKVMV